METIGISGYWYSDLVVVDVDDGDDDDDSDGHGDGDGHGHGGDDDEQYAQVCSPRPSYIDICVDRWMYLYLSL